MNTTTSTSTGIKNSPLPLIEVDGKLKIVGYSDAALHLFELKQDTTVASLGDLLGEVSDRIQPKLKKKETFTETLPVISRKGKSRWIRTTFYPIVDASTRFQVYFDDVTEGKNQYDLAIHAKRIAKIGSWKVDLVNNTITWSEMTKVIHEVPLDFVPDLEGGINFYKEGEHREKIVEAVSECIESGKSFDVELIIVTAKGNEKWVRSIGEAERNNGKTVGFFGVFQDIDEIKQAKHKNEVLNNRMRVAVESANIGIWDWDVVNNNLIWDDNMFSLFGLKRDEFQGAYEAWESVLHPEDKEQANYEVELALQGKKDFDTEFRAVKKDGSVVHIQGRAEVFRNDEGEPLRMVGINADITKLKRKDERLRKLLDTTEKQNQKLLNFAHIVSHNLRSNSSNISMLSGMLLSNIGTEETDKFLKMINTSSGQLEETLSQLNEIIRIQEVGDRDLQDIQVLPILESVCESINAIIEESGAEIKIKVPKNTKVAGIKPYLTSVFLNLLSNGIKYSNPQKKIKIRIEAKNLGNQTVLAFQDNGVGIDLNKYGKSLFGMYKTFHNNKDAKGLGLFMSKNQMEAMNGKIEVKSSVEKGSTFFLYFNNKK